MGEFLAADVSVLSISFQGYEVTLPESWPYLEAAFRAAKPSGIRRSFITNGMLLHKYAERIADLDPVRIAVSLDGGSAAANDAVRGLPGAFRTTIASVRRFLEIATDYRERVSVVSCLHRGINHESLLRLPRLLRELGISHWLLGFAVAVRGETFEPLEDRDVLRRQLRGLRRAADANGIRFYVNDEFGFVSDGNGGGMNARRVFDPEFLYRLDPLGYVRVGHEVLEAWPAGRNSAVDPRERNAVDVTRYRERAEVFLRRRSKPGAGGQSPRIGF